MKKLLVLLGTKGVERGRERKHICLNICMLARDDHTREDLSLGVKTPVGCTALHHCRRETGASTHHLLSTAGHHRLLGETKVAPNSTVRGHYRIPETGERAFHPFMILLEETEPFRAGYQI